MNVGDDLTVVVPDGPPRLGPAGWRALLRVLVDAAEEEWGPDWRARLGELRDDAEPGDGSASITTLDRKAGGGRKRE